MIDEKKIEEAAQGAADLYEQDLPIMSYNEDTEVDGQHHFCQEFGAEMFKDGAHWAINEFLKDLWHPVNEQPKHSKWIMTQFLDDDNDIAFEIDIAGPLIEWREYAKKYRIVKWLYVDDTLPR